MAESKVFVEFTGDAEGVTVAGRLTQQEIDRVAAKIDALRNPLNAMRQAWLNAFNITGAALKARQDIDGVGDSARKAKSEADSLAKTLKDLGKGAGVGLLVKQAQQYADTWTRSRNLMAAVGVEAQNLGATQDDLVRIATETRTALEPTVFLY